MSPGGVKQAGCAPPGPGFPPLIAPGVRPREEGERRLNIACHAVPRVELNGSGSARRSGPVPVKAAYTHSDMHECEKHHGSPASKRKTIISVQRGEINYLRLPMLANGTQPCGKSYLLSRLSLSFNSRLNPRWRKPSQPPKSLLLDVNAPARDLQG